MNLAPFWKRQAAVLDNLDFLIHEPAEVYHAKAREHLSSHQLADFRANPMLFRKKQLGLIPDGDRPAFLVGRSVHTLILEGRVEYERRYAVGGPTNPKTGAAYGSRTKAYQKWARLQSKPVLTDAQAELNENLAAAVHTHDAATGLLADGVAEGVIRCDYRGLPCQARIDWLQRSRGLADLKTCDDLTWFESDARRFGYVHQVAFYRALLAIATGELLPVHFIVVEKREPYRCGVWQVSADVLAIAQQENEEAMERLLRCRQLDRWPTGYEEVRVFDHL